LVLFASPSPLLPSASILIPLLAAGFEPAFWQWAKKEAVGPLSGAAGHRGHREKISLMLVNWYTFFCETLLERVFLERYPKKIAIQFYTDVLFLKVILYQIIP